MLKMLLHSAALAAATLSASSAIARAPAAAVTPAFTPTRFSVVVEGRGPDVILIPGLASPREVWDGARAASGGKYRLHLVQLNGFGGTAAGANADGKILDTTVAELARYIEANRLGSPAVVGHSMGGLLGLMLARAHPRRVGKLLIVDSLPFIGVLFDPNATVAGVEPRAAAMRDMLAAAAKGPPLAQEAAVATAAGMSRTPEGRARVGGWTRRADQRVVGQAMYEVMTTDLRADLPSIKTPITMLFPWNEGTLPEAQARPIYERAYAAAPNARLIAVPGSQHFIMLDQPARFHELLNAFLTGAE